MNKLTLFLLLNITFLFTSAQNQVLVKSELINSHKQLELIGFGLPAQNDIDLYKVWYNTIGVDGENDVASGLIVIPKTDESTALVCFQHGTSSPRENVPSNQDGHFGELFLGASGYVVSSADYLGMGESKGFHPYLHAETEASAAIDLLRATREFCEQQAIELNDQLFVTGYSQGGHSAMAAFRTLERDHREEFPITAAAPMSGPYNVTGTMLNGIIDPQEYLFPGYLVYIIRGYQEVYGDVYEELTDIFKPEYAAIMEKFDNREDYPLDQLQKELIDLLTEEHGASIPKFMFQDEIVEAILTNDDSNRLLQVMKENNLYDWVPEAPTRLYYCEADEQVPFHNAIFTDSVMTANGAADVVSLSMGESLDHFGCAIPAFLDVNTFFRSFTTTNTNNLNAEIDLILFPNPVQDKLYWDFDGQIEHITILDELGKVVLERRNLSRQSLDIQNLTKGLYFVQIYTKEGILTKKFVK